MNYRWGGYILFLWCLVIPSAQAATLYIDPTMSETGQGGSVVMAVRLDTTNEQCINAVDAVLTFDESLQVADISIGNSIFPIWIQPPVYDNTTHTISFAGGLPNGYCGRIPGDPALTNILTEIVFRTPANAPEGSIYPVRFTENAAAYLNDGQGTRIAVDTQDADIAVAGTYDALSDEAWRDRVLADSDAPEDFSVVLSRTNNAFQGKYFITFSTTDKQTGIDHYEVMEQPLDQFNFFNFGAATAPWQEVVSPYVLDDQSLNSTIFVKAVDKAGNEYIATLVPDEELRGVNVGMMVFYGAIAVVGVLLLGLLFAWWFVRRTHQRELASVQRVEQYDDIEDETVQPYVSDVAEAALGADHDQSNEATETHRL